MLIHYPICARSQHFSSCDPPPPSIWDTLLATRAVLLSFKNGLSRINVAGRKSIRQSLRQSPDDAAAEVSPAIPLAGGNFSYFDRPEIFRRCARTISHQ